ncbi:hypothetical protein SDC9_210697 [bioreactor metagenome]|uniref:Uncharacterized protein n=1 Tax=bioreactor metagenome TaxID=1076179 RepID=A0A645JS49_9ZZZZ
MQAVLGEMKNVARNNALLSVRIATNEQRLVEFDRELQKLSVLPSAATNEVPAFTPDLPTQPKP